MTSQPIIINLSDVEKKRELLRQIGMLQGLHEIKIKKRFRARSKKQNDWYHSEIVKSYYDYLISQKEVVTEDDCHEAFKYLFLRIKRTVVNPVTGEEVIFEKVGSTKELDTSQFADYCEHCREFLSSKFQIIVEDPDPNWKQNLLKKAA